MIAPTDSGQKRKEKRSDQGAQRTNLLLLPTGCSKVKRHNTLVTNPVLRSSSLTFHSFPPFLLSLSPLVSYSSPLFPSLPPLPPPSSPSFLPFPTPAPTNYCTQKDQPCSQPFRDSPTGTARVWSSPPDSPEASI